MTTEPQRTVLVGKDAPGLEALVVGKLEGWSEGHLPTELRFEDGAIPALEDAARGHQGTAVELVEMVDLRPRVVEAPLGEGDAVGRVLDWE